jgi:hypothetical protein
MGGGEGQFTANQGSEWTGSHHDAKEGFQVSRREYRNRDGDFQEKGQRGLSKDWVLHSDYINPVHIMQSCKCHANKELCLGYK